MSIIHLSIITYLSIHLRIYLKQLNSTEGHRWQNTKKWNLNNRVLSLWAWCHYSQCELWSSNPCAVHIYMLNTATYKKGALLIQYLYMENTHPETSSLFSVHLRPSEIIYLVSCLLSVSLNWNISWAKEGYCFSFSLLYCPRQQ